MSDIKAVFTKTFLLGAVILAALLATEGCTKKGKDVTIEVAGQKLTLPYKDTLRIRIASEPPSLDWDKATDTTSSEVVTNIMDGLAGYDYSKAEPEVVPLLA